MSAPSNSTRARTIAIVSTIALVCAGLWFTLGEAGPPSNESADRGNPTVATQPQLPAPHVEQVREDVWHRLRPAARDAVTDLLDAQDSSAQDPPSVDLGPNGVMTRLPDRYRPVIVSTRVDGERVIDEVMSIPPTVDTNSTAADRSAARQ